MRWQRLSAEKSGSPSTTSFGRPTDDRPWTSAGSTWRAARYWWCLSHTGTAGFLLLDGNRSIARIEYEHGIQRGLEIIPMLVEEGAAWSPSLIEALSDPATLGPLTEFKHLLGRGLSGYFSTPQSVEALLLFPLEHAGDRIFGAVSLPSASATPSVDDDAEVIIPYYADLASPPTVDERILAQLPKRILALDSTSARSGITIGFRTDRAITAGPLRLTRRAPMRLLRPHLRRWPIGDHCGSACAGHCNCGNRVDHEAGAP
jgi:hypothetical protein